MRYAVLAVATILSVAVLAIPDSLAKPKAQNTCADKHRTCIHYCEKAKKTEKEVKSCRGGCDLELADCLYPGKDKSGNTRHPTDRPRDGVFDPRSGGSPGQVPQRVHPERAKQQ